MSLTNVMQRRTIALNHAFEFQVLSLRQNRHAMIADVAARMILSPGCARSAEMFDRPFHHADTSRRDEDLVALALIHHFGVAGDELHSSIFGSIRSWIAQSGAVPRWKALLPG